MFTKYPIAGYAKTRLIPALGSTGAATVSRLLSERCIRTIREYKLAHENSNETIVRVYYTGSGCTETQMAEWLGHDVEYAVQSSGDLGARLGDAVSTSFDSGCSGLVIVGTDIPELSVEILSEAFASLDDNNVDVVLGPAEDGGYYLIGMRHAYLQLFQGISWSTDSVLSTTRSIAAANGLKVHLLRQLRDIDEPDDVEYVKRFVTLPAPSQSS